jgi:tight adherence protein C
MSPATYAIVAFVVVLGVTFLTGLALLQLWPAVARRRLGAPTSQASATSILRWDEQATTTWQRVFERLGRRFGPRDRTKQSRYRQRLSWGGFHNPIAVWYFTGGKVAFAVIGALAYPFLGLVAHRVMPNVLAYSVGLAVAGFFLPDFWLRNRIKERQRRVINALPDVLDLLMVCVEAGMGFDAAVARVAEREEARHSPLHQEMLRMHLEVRAGRPRQESMRAFGDRTGVQEVKSMVGAFIQTERLGTPLGKTLRVHAESARVQRRHRAEERAYMAPLKMIFPTVLFLMPSFFLVAMAPPILSLMKVFQSLGGR